MEGFDGKDLTGSHWAAFFGFVAVGFALQAYAVWQPNPSFGDRVCFTLAEVYLVMLAIEKAGIAWLKRNEAQD